MQLTAAQQGEVSRRFRKYQQEGMREATKHRLTYGGTRFAASHYERASQPASDYGHEKAETALQRYSTLLPSQMR